MNAVSRRASVVASVGVLEAHGAHDSLAAPCIGDTRASVRRRPSSSIGRRSRPTCAGTCPSSRDRRASTSSREHGRSRSFPGGHSNLTYLVRFGGAELVVRRPPLGPVPPKAHDMAREFRWLAALHPRLSARAAARTCSARTRRHRLGVLRRWNAAAASSCAHEEPPALANHPEARRRVSEALVDTLADLHAIDVTARPLGDARQAGRVRRAPGARVDRALARIARRRRCRRWTRSPTGCATHLPPDPTRRRSCTATSSWTTCCSIPLDVGRIVAVFDWEMSALGDPLVDLGILLAYWSPTAPPEQRDALTTVTDRPGYLTRSEIIERYAARSGRDVSRHPFLRDVRAVQDRGRHPADLLPLRAGPDHRPALRDVRRARRVSGAPCSGPCG